MTGDQAYTGIVHSVIAGRLAQAYIVAAPPRGAGDELARRALALLLCNAPNPPCGACSKCSAVARGTHPDVHRLEPQKKSRVISVEQMREYLKRINTTTFEGGWKGGVIMAADCLNTAAANAFLKTLEEPPEKTVFFLLTDSPQRLLPTILSRCQRIELGESEAAVAMISEADREVLYAVLGTSGEGRVADAFGRADRLTSHLKAVKEAIRKEEKAAVKGDDTGVDEDTLEARIGSRHREWRHGILQTLLNWYRDVLVLVCGADACHVICRDALDMLRAAAVRTSYREAIDQVRTVEVLVTQMNRNLPESLVFEHAFMKLK